MSQPDTPDVPAGDDAAWREASAEIRAAKEEALLVMMGRKPLTAEVVNRARQAWDSETRLMDRYPGYLPLRVDLGSLSADVGYLDLGPATLPDVTFEPGGELARYLADVLRQLADQLAPGQVQRIPLPPGMADDIRRELADSGIVLPDGCEVHLEFRPIDVHNTAIDEAGAHGDDKQP